MYHSIITLLLYHSTITGIGTVIWSPLASGILTGKYDDGIPIYSRAALKVGYHVVYSITRQCRSMPTILVHT